MSEQCKQSVWRDWSSSNCARKAVKDGYCKQHHPDAVKERQEKASARWNEKVNNSDSAKLRRALAAIEQLTKERDELEQGNADIRTLYNDLLFEVVNKIPNETRHDTAKRIIRQHELRGSMASQAEGEQ